jgi:aryl-alcohol dehydrogenase-like predicted oxidoreductase
LNAKAFTGKAINQQHERMNMKTGNTTNETKLGGGFTFPGTSLTVQRMGYGAMQLAGTGVYGPPKDPEAAVAVLREAVAAGVNHIDTSDFYGPHVTNQIIKKSLYPYPAGLVIVTKLGARLPADGSWKPAISPQDLTEGVHDNLRNLGLDALDIVDYRAMGAVHRVDAAHLFRLALEKGAARACYHGVAEEGVAFWQIAEVIGRRLNVPVISKTPEEAAHHFAWFAHFAAIDVPASSKQTQQNLGWRPTQPGLIADLDRPTYFEA